MGEGEGSDCPPKTVTLDAVTTATKKLARQLDFTGYGGLPVTTPLPEQPPQPPALPPLPSAKIG